MNYKEIIYPTLKNRIESFLDEEVAGEDGSVQQAVVDFLDTLETVHGSIESAYEGSDALESRCLEACYISLSESSQYLADPFPGWREFRLLLEIAKIIEHDSGLDLEDDIGFTEDHFNISEFTENRLPVAAMGFHNNSTPQNSLAYLDLSSQNLTNDIEEYNYIAAPLLCLFLYKLDKLVGGLDPSKKYVLHRLEADNLVSIGAALKMQAALRGIRIHESSYPPRLSANVSIIEKINPCDEYQQFYDSLTILSEFNGSNSLLGAYISIYHVIEGFMFKIPIVNLGRDNGNRIFSLRDFRRLSKNIDEHETTAIQNLFTVDRKGKFWDKDIDTLKFRDIVRSAINQLPHERGWDQSDCDNLLTQLNIKSLEDYASLCDPAILNGVKYAQLVYQVRCAIVHNKETELHISHFNLNPTVSLLIDKVLITPLHTLIAYLLTDKGGDVWYDGPELKLYG